MVRVVEEHCESSRIKKRRVVGNGTPFLQHFGEV